MAAFSAAGMLLLPLLLLPAQVPALRLGASVLNFGKIVHSYGFS
jgi:hypothetical protein